jgi:tetratricopeptide (TPR) repeat protein
MRKQTAITTRVAFFCALVVSMCGARALADGSYHERLSALDERLKADPSDAQIWFQRGCLCFWNGDWQVALVDLEKVDRLASGKYPTDWWRGQALAAGGQLVMAKTVLDDFIASHRDHAGALLSRARVLSKLGRMDESVADYRASLARSPQAEPDLIVEVADALAKQGMHEAAVGALDVGIGRLGRTPSLVMRAIEMEIAAGQFDAALHRVESMRKTGARPEPWMARRASILAQAGRLDKSRAAWRKIIAHLAQLPVGERTSHAMSIISEQARMALTSLDSIAQTSTKPLPAQ